MVARRNEPKPGKWSHTIDELTAYERPDRNNDIYTRIWKDGQVIEKKRLCDPIRDERGRVVHDLEVAALKAAGDRLKAFRAGLEHESAGPLTLAEAFRRLLHRSDGKYASNSRWKGDVRRASGVILRILGRDLLCSQLRHAHYRKLWRAMADEHVRDGTFGPRQAEVICGALRSCVVWLQQEETIEQGTALPALKWKDLLRTEWREITGRPIPAPKKPRYTPEEQERLWAALPKADPRLRLAVLIGAELRLGQVPRSMRSDVIPHGGVELGAIPVHGAGKKHGALVVLDEEQRWALVHALTIGHLADLEAARKAGKIDEYPLIPGGRLRTVGDHLRASVEYGRKPWGETGIGKAWRKLEAIAGVEHKEGRRWYGLRRLSTDLAEDVESDARTLNQLGGWAKTETRVGYQQQGRTEIAERARAVRTKIRPKTRADNELRETVESGA